MDLSGLIFVALAVAWAAYLIPKAMRHHDDVVRGRSIDRFSHSLRVLARREPVSARAARLVVAPGRVATVEVTAKPAAQALAHDSALARRPPASSAAAARRRRRVLTGLLLVLLAVTGGCASGRVAWPYVAIPVGLLVAWLVACRVMVKRERSRRPALAEESVVADVAPEMETFPQVSKPGETRDPELWDPVPVTLPTYVSKPPARRTVRTIDLDSTGVWTSGRTDADSALAREAEAADRVRRRAERKREAGEEAVGS